MFQHSGDLCWISHGPTSSLLSHLLEIKPSVNSGICLVFSSQVVTLSFLHLAESHLTNVQMCEGKDSRGVILHLLELFLYRFFLVLYSANPGTSVSLHLSLYLLSQGRLPCSGFVPNCVRVQKLSSVRKPENSSTHHIISLFTGILGVGLLETFL